MTMQQVMRFGPAHFVCSYMHYLWVETCENLQLQMCNKDAKIEVIHCQLEIIKG